MGWWLNLIISEVFFNLNDSIIYLSICLLLSRERAISPGRSVALVFRKDEGVFGIKHLSVLTAMDKSGLIKMYNVQKAREGKLIYGSERLLTSRQVKFAFIYQGHALALWTQYAHWEASQVNMKSEMNAFRLSRLRFC